MKLEKIIRFFVIIGCLFWGGMAVYAFGRLILLNGVVNLFDFKCINAKVDSFKVDENDVAFIEYSYFAKKKAYVSKLSMVNDPYKMNVKQDSVQICYNESFPQISYWGTAKPLWSIETFNICLSLFFIALIFLLGLFAKKEYWVNKYRNFFNRNKTD